MREGSSAPSMSFLALCHRKGKGQTLESTLRSSLMAEKVYGLQVPVPSTCGLCMQEIEACIVLRTR